MANTVTVKIEGLKELDRKIADLKDKVARKHLRAAVAAGARIVKREVEATAPELTGALKANIYAKQVREESGVSRQTFFVGVRSGLARYANTKANRQSGKAGKVYKTAGRTFYWRFIEFGTEKMAARPFIVPAFEKTKQNSADAIVETLARRIEKEVGS